MTPAQMDARVAQAERERDTAAADRDRLAGQLGTETQLSFARLREIERLRAELETVYTQLRRVTSPALPDLEPDPRTAAFVYVDPFGRELAASAAE